LLRMMERSTLLIFRRIKNYLRKNISQYFLDKAGRNIGRLFYICA
jgi:hypothetical protein